ncbi:hypothetical protein DPMN_095897 [Dreissena polymorpha]|uniref:Uncharacterized protein n=1 Tax=Dreissena polymorpha TaxID=45954 RepID=A0A9D4L8G1_DREPO|nr:hypothetical protein DPMN_095897 [Dreissena polymorpha]
MSQVCFTFIKHAYAVNQNGLLFAFLDSKPSKNEISYGTVPDSANPALNQIARYMEAENIKRQLGERRAQECYTAASIQEYNEAWPKPSKIPAQFQDDRHFAANRVRSQYVAEVRECYSYISEQYDPVLRDRDLDNRRQSLLEKKMIENENKQAEMRREAELDLARQELLHKKELEKFKKRRKKKHSESGLTAVLSNESQAVMKYDETSVDGIDSVAHFSPCTGKQVVKHNDVNKGLYKKHEAQENNDDTINIKVEKYANAKNALNKNPDVCGYENDMIRKLDGNEVRFKKAYYKSPDVQGYKNEMIIKIDAVDDCLEKADNNNQYEHVNKNDVTRMFDVKKAFKESENMVDYENDIVRKLVANICDIKKDEKINAKESEVRNDALNKIEVHRNNVNESVVNTKIDTSEIAAAPLCGNPDWTPESMIQRIRRLNLKYPMGHNGTKTEPATPKCDKPETTSYANTEPAPPKCDKPETRSYNRARRYKFIESGPAFDFVKNCNYVPTPPACKPKEDLVSVAKNDTDCIADNTIQRIKDDLKAKGETELRNAEMRKGYGGISYMIDTNTFCPSTSRREITRAHEEVVTGQFRKHEKPAVMSWNATTAKMKVGFKSKIRKEQDQTSGDKT